MSDTQSSASFWFLDCLTEALDLRTDANDKVVEIRQHFTVQRHAQGPVENVPALLSIGQRLTSVDYQLGGISKAKDATGGGKFICVEDGLSPVGHPGNMVVRRQTWEFFGKYIAAPTEWDV
jgi:hypothetical protein